MKRIIFSILFVLSSMTAIFAAQPALQINYTDQQLAAKLASILCPQNPLQPLVLHHANGAAVPANMPEYTPQVYAGMLVGKLPQSAQQALIDALDAYAKIGRAHV